MHAPEVTPATTTSRPCCLARHPLGSVRSLDHPQTSSIHAQHSLGHTCLAVRLLHDALEELNSNCSWGPPARKHMGRCSHTLVVHAGLATLILYSLYAYKRGFAPPGLLGLQGSNEMPLHHGIALTLLHTLKANTSAKHQTLQGHKATAAQTAPTPSISNSQWPS